MFKKIDKDSLPENVRGLVNKTKTELLNIIDRKDNVEKELNTKLEVANKKADDFEHGYTATKKAYAEKCEKHNALIKEHQKLQQDYLDLKEGYEELENKDKVLLSNSKSLKNDIDRLLNEKNAIDNIRKRLIDDKEKLSKDYSIILDKLDNCNKNNSRYKFMFVVYTIILIVLLLCNLM